MIHHLNESIKSYANPADEPDVSNILCTVDDHIRKQNGHKISLEIQILLYPLWSIKSQFLDMSLPLQNEISSYMSIRHKMVEIDKAIGTREATSTEVEFIFLEIMKLLRAYDLYIGNLLVIRRDLVRQVNFLSAHGNAIWDDINHLAVTDESTCKSHAYCIKVSMKEYQRLEGSVQEATESCFSIVESAKNYLLQISQMVPDILLSSELKVYLK